ncbi:MAG: pyridoxal-phosphate dependent enzyme [Tepidisphaeraceae bacterium]
MHGLDEHGPCSLGTVWSDTEFIVPEKRWLHEAVSKIEADCRRTGETPMIHVELPASPGVALYVKDETQHPTGSLQHRVARSLFIYALCNGTITRGSTAVASAVDPAVFALAYFSRLIGLRFVAAIPDDFAADQRARIEQFGGVCHRAEPDARLADVAEKIAAESGGHVLDSGSSADNAIEWRREDSIAEAILLNFDHDTAAAVRWIVGSAEESRTLSMLSRQASYRRLPTQIGAVIQPDMATRLTPADRTLVIPADAGFAGNWFLEKCLRRRFDTNAGLNVWGTLSLIGEMVARGETGSVVCLVGEHADRPKIACVGTPLETLARSCIDQLDTFMRMGEWSTPITPPTAVTYPVGRFRSHSFDAGISPAPLLDSLEEQTC